MSVWITLFPKRASSLFLMHTAHIMLNKLWTLHRRILLGSFAVCHPDPVLTVALSWLLPEPRGQPSRFHHGVQGVRQVWAPLLHLLHLLLLFPQASSPDGAHTRLLQLPRLLPRHDRVRRGAAAPHHVPPQTPPPPSALPRSARDPLGAGPRQLLPLLHLRGLAAHPNAALSSLHRVVRGGQKLRACAFPLGRLPPPSSPTPHALLRRVCPQLDGCVWPDGRPPRSSAPRGWTATKTVACVILSTTFVCVSFLQSVTE